MVKALETPSKTSLSAPEGAYTDPSEGQPQDQSHDGFSDLPVVPGFNLHPVASLVILAHAAFILAGVGSHALLAKWSLGAVSAPISP